MESHTINLPHYKEAFEMVKKPHTCFQTLKTRRHIALSPKYTSCIIKGIHEILNSDLAVYSDVLDGIPIAFNKPKCVQKYGSIMDENPYMQFDVEVDYILFQPRKGDILLGRVNKLAADHVGCLVHGTFNASIHRPRNDQATSTSDWAGSHLNGGDEVLFEVLGLNTRGVVSMYGKLTDESSCKIMKNNKAVQKKRKRENSFSETGFDDSSSGLIVDSDMDDAINSKANVSINSLVIKDRKKRKIKNNEKNSSLSHAVETSMGDNKMDNVTMTNFKTDSKIHFRKDKCSGKIKDKTVPYELVDPNSNDAKHGISSNSQAVQAESGLLFTGLLDRNSEKRNKPYTDISHAHKKKKHKKDKSLKSIKPIIISPKNENYSTAGFAAEKSMLIKTDHVDGKSQLYSLNKKKKHKKRKVEPGVDSEILHRRSDSSEHNEKSRKNKKFLEDNKEHGEGPIDVRDKYNDTLQSEISAIQNSQKVGQDIDDFAINKPKKKKKKSKKQK